MQHRGQAALAHIGADALDDARRRQRLAEHFLRKSAALRRHDVALRAQLFAQAAQLLAGSGLGETDAADVPAINPSRRYDGLKTPITAVKFALDSRLAVVGGKDGTLCLLDTDVCQEVRRFTGPKDEVLSVACSADGKHILAGTKDGTLWSWSADEAKARGKLEGHREPVLCLAFVADGKRCLSG